MKRIVNLIVCLSVCLSIAAQIKTYQHKIDTKVITVKPKNASNAEMKSLDVITSNALGYYDIAVLSPAGREPETFKISLK